MNRRNEYSGQSGQGSGSQRPQQRYSQEWSDEDNRSGRNRMEASYDEDYDVRAGSDDRGGYAGSGRSYERGYSPQGGMRGSEGRDEYGRRGMTARNAGQGQNWGYGDYDTERQASYSQGRGNYMGAGAYEGGYGGGNFGQNRFGATHGQPMGSGYGGYERDSYPGGYAQGGGWNDSAGYAGQPGYPGPAGYAQRGPAQTQSAGQWGGSQGMGAEQWGRSGGNLHSAEGAFGQQGTYGQGNYGQAGQGTYGQSGYAQTNYWGQSQGGGQYGGMSAGQGRGRNDMGHDSASYGATGRQGGGFGGAVMQQGGYPSQRMGSADQGMGQRNYSGRGPKGYARSDERLREDINERLTDDPLIDASDVSVEVRDGKVTLTGQVEARWQKHSIEDLVDRCSGVKDIDNRLSIAGSRNTSLSGTTASGSGTSTGSSNFGGQGDSEGLSGSSSSRSSSAGSTSASGSSASSTPSGSSSNKKN